ncbi:recombination protein RecT [Amycolatopsis thailandensis]|uniref:recombination protein RecT n=1 Tax=Amycolatopsis thailandensis TaxID=589330 RepID=UPI00364C29CF
MGTDLTQRVRRNTSGEKAPARTDADEKATREEAGRKMLGTQIAQMQNSFQAAMPRGTEAAQLVRDAMTCLRQTPKLATCEPQSVLGALMTCAQLGLRPGVLGHAWVLPFWDNRFEWLDDRGRKRTGGFRAQLIVGYQGMVALAYRSDQLQDLVARTVYENDVFEVEYGLDDKLVHKPLMTGDRGEPIAYYAVAKLTTGGRVFYVMSHPDMLEYRDKYAMAKNRDGEIVGPWRDNFESMALKTCVRQLSKWLPKSTEFASAIEADGTIRVDASPNPDAMLHGEQPLPDLDGEVVDHQPDAAAEKSATEGADPVPTVDEHQMKRLHAQLGELGVTDRDRHRTLAMLLQREISSANDITADEMPKLIEMLADILKQGDPKAVLQATLAQLGNGES